MSEKILVCYASVYGSTEETAEKISEFLKEQGKNAEVLPVKEVKSFDDYAGVILGFPLYLFRIQKQARKFIQHHKKNLSNKPVAVFALGPWETDKNQLSEAQDCLEKRLKEYGWFKPVDMITFGGKFDPASLRFPYSLIPALKQVPANDARDWDRIRKWALELQL